MMTNAEIDALPITKRAKHLMRWLRDNDINWRDAPLSSLLRCKGAGRKSANEVIALRQILQDEQPPQAPDTATVSDLIREVIVALERLSAAVEQNKDRT